MIDLPTYVLEREFMAPRELVWRAWTQSDLLARWYGPNVETVIHRLDVATGGLWLTEMRMGENSHFQRAEFTDVVAPERLVCLMSNTDENWNTVPNPMMANWPRVLLTTVTFEDNGDRTAMRLVWSPHDASEAEITCFASAIAGMNKGWAAGMEMLEALLAELQA